MTPEAEVMAYIKNYFKFDRGVYLTRHNVGAVTRGNRVIRFGSAGESDFFGVIEATRCPRCGKVTGTGVALFIEAKGPKGRLTVPQREFLGAMKRLGAVTLVAQPKPSKDDPTGFLTLKKELDKVKQRYCLECHQAGADRKEQHNGKNC